MSTTLALQPKTLSAALTLGAKAFTANLTLQPATYAATLNTGLDPVAVSIPDFSATDFDPSDFKTT